MTCRLSVIVPHYRSEDALRVTLSSVWDLEQPEHEVIVVDNKSLSDGVQEEILAVARRRGGLLRVLSGPDRGEYHAMNKGLDSASGAHVCFLMCGDELRSFDSAALEAGKICLMTITRVTKWGTFQHSRPRRWHWLGIPYPHQGYVYPRDPDIRYDERHSIAADYLYTLQMMAKYPTAVGCHVGTVVYREGPSAENFQKRDRQTRDIVDAEFGSAWSKLFWAKQTLVNVVRGLVR